jgi:hypothetical protein
MNMLVRLLVVSPLIKNFKFNKISVFETLYKVSMNTNPRLIINCCYFVTINCKVPCCINNNSNGNEDNVMHNFYNLLSNIIILMFLWIVFYLQEMEQ